MKLTARQLRALVESVVAEGKYSDEGADEDLVGEFISDYGESGAATADATESASDEELAAWFTGNGRAEPTLSQLKAFRADVLQRLSPDPMGGSLTPSDIKDPLEKGVDSFISSVISSFSRPVASQITDAFGDAVEALAADMAGDIAPSGATDPDLLDELQGAMLEEIESMLPSIGDALKDDIKEVMLDTLQAAVEDAFARVSDNHR